MDYTKLPVSGVDMIGWEWSQIKPYFDDLQARSLDEDSVEAWLKDWTRLSELVDEGGFRLYVRTTQNTADEVSEQQYAWFNEEIRPRISRAEQVLKQKLLASRLEPDGFEVPLSKMQLQAEIFRDENLPLLSEDLKLAVDYVKLLGAHTIDWEGRPMTTLEMMPLLEVGDRSVRERAWRLRLARWIEDRPAIDGLWVKMLELRKMIASNANEPDYRAYRWKQLLRMDYTPKDTLAFHEAIEEVVVPAATRLYEKRRRRMGVEKLRQWDLRADQFDAPPLRPFKTIDEFQSKTAAIFHSVDPELGQYFDVMLKESLLDLDTRPNKAPGGYSQPLEAVKRPFIFFSSTGIQLDVDTMLHEGGHAFHTFESSHLPYFQQRGEAGLPMEIAEVASISMELLGMPYMGSDHGGFYGEEELARAKYRKLEDFIVFWPYMSVMDSFQHWVYTHIDEAMDVAACDAVWRGLWDRFMKGVDWTGDGVDDYIDMRWRLQGHLFDGPFYYVEYGLAQLGAVQVWANALKDQQAAVSQYRAALRLGGSKHLPELYQAAGAKFAFDAGTLKQAVDLIEEEMDKLDAGH